MPRLRPFETVAKKNPQQAIASPAGKFDLWLQRASLIAQPLLLLVALATIKLTVVPLYEKALLDEALAKREIELKETTKKLDAHYRTLRWYAARSFAQAAMRECGYTNAEMAWMMGPIDEGLHTPREPIDREKLRVNVGSCVEQLANSTEELEDLRQSDRESLRTAIQRIGNAVAPIQAKAVVDYEEAPRLASKDPEKYLQQSANRRKAEAVIRGLGLKLPEREIAADATSDLRQRIMSDYTSKIIDVMNTELRAWAKEVPKPTEAPGA